MVWTLPHYKPRFWKLSENEEYNKPGVTFAKVDIDAVYEVAKELGVRF